jgi:hypothetical protein
MRIPSAYSPILSMAPGGCLAVVEMVLPGRNEPHVGPLMDLNMMVMTGGIERTEAEYAGLLAGAGFAPERVTGTKSPFSVIEAVLVCRPTPLETQLVLPPGWRWGNL